ncbi:Calcium-dependent protein kinase 4 [Mortierella sp. AM989]|nr:Calcium-dependent protein kinase 4 [Mortierella sp. AM989]
MESVPLPHSKHVDWQNPELAYRMYLCYISLFFDAAVLMYHFTTPFHPKFYVRPTRRRVLRLHIFSGCLEILACVAAFYAEDPTNYSYAAAVFAIISHVPSTFYQIPTVLGIKAFLVPSLGMVTALHGYFAYNLVKNPTSFYYLMSTYLTVHIYAWSRVFFALYYRLKLFESHRFSAAMLTSGMLLVPSVMGLSGNVILLVGVITSDIVLRYCNTHEFWVSWTTEHPRELASSPDKKIVLDALITAAEISNSVDDLLKGEEKDRYAHICRNVMSANVRHNTPRAKAETVFRAIDLDKDNELSIDEFKNFLLTCGISQYEMENKLLLEGLFENRKVTTIDEFCTWFTKNWIHTNSITIPHMPRTPRGQAKLVFDTLDSDSSGRLDVEELGHLLASWGLPQGEAVGYLKRHDMDGNNSITFQEFYQNMPTVWKFAIQSFIDEGKILIEN